MTVTSYTQNSEAPEGSFKKDDAANLCSVIVGLACPCVLWKQIPPYLGLSEQDLLLSLAGSSPM